MQNYRRLMCEPVPAKEEQKQTKIAMLKRALEMEKGVEHGRGNLRQGTTCLQATKVNKQLTDQGNTAQAFGTRLAEFSRWAY